MQQRSVGAHVRTDDAASASRSRQAQPCPSRKALEIRSFSFVRRELRFILQAGVITATASTTHGDSASCTCSRTNFTASLRAGREWLDRTAGVTGRVLSMPDALATARETFAALLDPTGRAAVASLTSLARRAPRAGSRASPRRPGWLIAAGIRRPPARAHTRGSRARPRPRTARPRPGPDN